jgi:hypothetical protein
MRRLIHGAFVTAVAGLTVCGLRAAPALTGEDVGTGTFLPGSTTVVGDLITIEGGGADIWGTADQFHYAYFQVTGDFDYIAKIEDLLGNGGDGGWSKVELMARNDDGAGFPSADDPHISNMTTRKTSDTRSTTATAAPAGVNHRGPQWRAIRANQSSWTQPQPGFPPNYPDNWVRLERVGSTFWMYTSNDGVTWNGYNPFVNQGWDTAGSWPPGADNPGVAFFTNAWPNTILLGIAVTAHSAADISIAQVSNFKEWTPVPIQITQQPPATVDISANSSLSISVQGTGDPVHYQWLKDGVPITASQAAPSAVSSTYTVALAQVSDSGTYTCRLFGAKQTAVVSSPCVVTVTQDVTPPTLVRAIGAPNRTQVTITFSEPVRAPSATTASNYQIPGLTPTVAALSADGRQVTLTTPQQALDTKYTITVNNVQDGGGNPVAAGSTIVFNSAKFAVGLAQWQRWHNWTGDIAGLIAGYEAGTLGPPTVTWQTTTFESGRDLADNYGGHGFTWFKPPSSGDYRFIITADDNARLFISTDDNPANKVLIAAESGWSNNREWTSASDEQDTKTAQPPYTDWPTFEITLDGTKTYYMEVFWDEGGGGDGAEITFTPFADARPANGTASAMTGERIGSYVDPTTLPPVISAPTANSAVTLDPGSAHTLSVTASGATSYQWQLNGVDIPGATSADYVIASAQVLHTGQYWAFAINENGSVRSPLINVLVKATGVFAIEAEDFDSEGQPIAAASTMPYPGGFYNGLSATHGVDYFSNNGTDSPVYRGGAVLAAGTAAPMAAETAGSQFSMTRMGEWEMTANYKIGWIAAGDWGNYTRTFPTPAKEYWVFAGTSNDGTGANAINQNLGIVTAGVGTASQTVQKVGNFRAPGTAGWSRNNLVAMTDDAGAIATVEVGGTATIRWNYDGGDVDYLVFVPATPSVDEVTVTAVRNGNQVTITSDPAALPAGWVLQTAPSINGPWTTQPGATTPISVDIGAGNAFLRATKP